METQRTTQERNNQLIDLLSTDGMEKKAVDAVSNFTRTTMREDGFSPKILPEVQVVNSDLVRQTDTDKPAVVVDKENGSPAAISLPFANLPRNFYILAPRYRVLFDRVMSHRFTKDVDELRTYVMDVRQVISDNAVKDMLAEQDSKFLSSINTALGAIDTVNPIAGVALFQSISGSMSRDECVEMLKIPNRTPFRLESEVCLTNFVSWKNFMKWRRDEVGGDGSEKIVKNGMMEEQWLGRRWVVTIKRNLVPDEEVYLFPNPKFLGKLFVMEDCTMFLKREAFMLEWFFYKTMGGAIGHIGGVGRARFV